MGARAPTSWRSGGRGRATGAPHTDLSPERTRPSGPPRARPRPSRDSGNDMNKLSSLLRVAALWVSFALAIPASAQRLLVPMDDSQEDHLKAYGVTYNALKEGLTGEWLLNYRGG